LILLLEVTYTYDNTPNVPIVNVPIVNVPEPTSIAFLGLAITGFVFSRKAKKSA